MSLLMEHEYVYYHFSSWLIQINITMYIWIEVYSPVLNIVLQHRRRGGAAELKLPSQIIFIRFSRGLRLAEGLL